MKSHGIEFHTASENRRSQSRRDCVYQPRVARNELPWVVVYRSFQPQRGCVTPERLAATPLGLMPFQHRFQGSSCLATLGFGPKSLRDFSASPRLWDQIKFDSHRNFQLDAIRSVVDVFAALLN